MVSIIIHCARIERAGGIETALQNLVAKLSQQHKVLVLYEYAHEDQLKYLEDRGATCLKNNREIIYCHILLRMNYWSRPENIIASKVYDVIHANFSELAGYNPLDYRQPDEYIAVSSRTKASFLESKVDRQEKNKRISIINNLLNDKLFLDTPKRKRVKKLKLLSVTRLTEEKGGKRIIQLADMMTKESIDFIWDVYSPTDHLYSHPNVNFHDACVMTPELIENYDYLVQLSDTESFCYAIHESLQSRTPVIVTDWPGVRDVVDNNKNGYVLPMDMNFDIHKIMRVPKITTAMLDVLKKKNRDAEDAWGAILETHSESVPVKVQSPFVDIRGNIHRETGSMFFCDRERANELIGKNFVVEVVEWITLL